MKIALVYDRVNKFGGAERVLLSLKKLFPDAPLYTLVYKPQKALWAKEFLVIPTFLNKISFLRSKHELLAPIAPMAFETLDLKEFDVIISITSADAKSVITNPNQLHICYCLTPTRYFWSGQKEYQKDIKMRLLPRFLRDVFKYLDLVIASRPDIFLSISNEVKSRVKKYYLRNSEIIYPPVDDKFFTDKPLDMNQRDYYLFVSRLVSYKKADLVVKVFRLLDLPLVVVGEGSEKARLKNLAGSRTIFTGAVSDEKLIEYYRHAIATVFPQHEDFGIVPIESQACGTPVIAYGRGGATETVIDKKTGLFFKHQTQKSLLKSIKKFQTLKFNPQDCINNAKKFSEQNFLREFKKHFNEACESQMLGM